MAVEHAEVFTITAIKLVMSAVGAVIGAVTFIWTIGIAPLRQDNTRQWESIHTIIQLEAGDAVWQESLDKRLDRLESKIDRMYGPLGIDNEAERDF